MRLDAYLLQREKLIGEEDAVIDIIDTKCDCVRELLTRQLEEEI